MMRREFEMTGRMRMVVGRTFLGILLGFGIMAGEHFTAGTARAAEPVGKGGEEGIGREIDHAATIARIAAKTRS